MARLVYIADDEVALADLMGEMMELQGFEARVFYGGAAVVDAALERAPDLILLDINMPGMAGWEVRALLRDDPRTRHVPVIAVTAQTGAAAEQSAIRTFGFAGFVAKPFRYQVLVEAVETALQATPAGAPGAAGNVG